MNLKITGKGLKITDGIRNHLDSKLNKIFHDLDEDTSVHIFLSVEKDRHIAEVNLKKKSHAARASDETDNLYKSIDGALKKIESHLKKIKGRMQDLKIKCALETKTAIKV